MEFDNKNYPSTDANIFIPRLGQLLKSFPDYKVKLVADYTDDNDLKNANSRLGILKDMLQKYGAQANQLQTQIIISGNQQQQKQMLQKKSYSVHTASVIIYGIGFKEVSPPGYDNDNYKK